jgi:4-hydroxy-tetrahydrodipicolinate synthase
MTDDIRRPFGRVLTAMVTPFTADGGLDLAGAQRLAVHLVDEGGSDGLVVSGTTGESPTTTDDEKDRLLRAVVEAVGDRAAIVAGVGTNDTAHTLHLAHAAEKAGADGLLAVTPYYSKPPQAGLLAHFQALAEATEVPTMLYDIPGRTGTAIETETMVRLAEHPRIVAVKDAKGDLEASAWVMARTDLAFYSGDDKTTLPLLSVGGVGVVGVPTHVVGVRTGEMIRAYEGGDVRRALDLHRALLPAFTGFFRTQGVILAKAALRLAGLPGGPVRPPLVDATPDQVDRLRGDLAAAGVPLPPATLGVTPPTR